MSNAYNATDNNLSRSNLSNVETPVPTIARLARKMSERLLIPSMKVMAKNGKLFVKEWWGGNGFRAEHGPFATREAALEFVAARVTYILEQDPVNRFCR